MADLVIRGVPVTVVPEPLQSALVLAIGQEWQGQPAYRPSPLVDALMARFEAWDRAERAAGRRHG